MSNRDLKKTLGSDSFANPKDTPLPEVPRALKDLSEQADRLEDRLCELRDKLEPVLRHDHETDCETTPDFPEAPLAKQITSHARHLSMLGDRVEDLIRRLEV